MLVNLPNGKTIEITFEEYLKLEVDGYHFALSEGMGSNLEDPFYRSHLKNPESERIREMPEEEEDEEPDEDDGYFEEETLTPPADE